MDTTKTETEKKTELLDISVIENTKKTKEAILELTLNGHSAINILTKGK